MKLKVKTKSIFFFFFIAFAIATTFCSKEVKLNKQITGKWKVLSFEGTILAKGDEISFEFFKTSKKQGTGKISFTDEFGNNLTQDFTYSLFNKQINITSAFLGLDNQTYTIIESNKAKLKILNNITRNTTEMKKM